MFLDQRFDGDVNSFLELETENKEIWAPAWGDALGPEGSEASEHFLGVKGKRVKTMEDEGGKITPEEISRMIERAGLSVPSDQLEKLRAGLARIEEAAGRIREGLERNDEPAFAFRVRK
ncbi:MAG: hypothetical protein ACE1ZE_00885 [Candidatus Binatia bacterium]